MTETVLSKKKIPIRLTDERWAHITDEHCELAGLRLDVLETVNNPSEIFAGKEGELLAVQEFSPRKYLVVVYREFEKDGFIITAFLTSKIQSLDRRIKLWPSN
jgi:hypothetical protein